MSKKKIKKDLVISSSNKMTILPLFGTIIIYLFLDNFETPVWLFAVAGTIMAIFWIVSIVGMFNEKRVDIFEAFEIMDAIKEDDDTSEYRGKSFWEKIDIYKTNQLLEEAADKRKSFSDKIEELKNKKEKK